MNYAAHIAELCFWLGVTHTHTHDLALSYSTREPRRLIVTPPVEDATTYWVALHELGHIALDHEAHASFFITPRILEKEGEAWQWALDNAREPMTPATAARCVDFLSSYLIVAPPEVEPPEITERAYNALRAVQLSLD